MKTSGLRLLAFGVAIVFACMTRDAAAEAIKVGTLKQAPYGVVSIAQQKGYFTAEGLDVEIVTFDSAEPVPVGVVSGDLAFGVVGTSAAMFSLAAQGALKLVGGNQREVPHFQYEAIVAANRAYAAGLTSAKDFGGHSATVTQIGSPPHYGLALLAEKFGIDLNTVRILPLQTIPNEVSALVGGQADFGLLPSTAMLTPAERGDLKLLGWAGDEVRWQLSVMVTATKTANSNPDLVQRYLRAVRRGMRDYHDAFTGPGETRADGPTAPDIYAMLAKFTGQTVQQLKGGIAYIDPEARVDAKDIAHQIAWFTAQHMVKGALDPARFIDARYALTLPEK
ncbi:MAG TPA: ABC transporter substrate-binding protein [Stellaceae bacterium]|jgi:NitT/TauT family transport system substrate-binding protein|nr:ABC transporter substrate-binding protein [Stellaceae bacterium]